MGFPGFPCVCGGGAHFNEVVERRERIIEFCVMSGGNSGIPGLISDFLHNRPPDSPSDDERTKFDECQNYKSDEQCCAKHSQSTAYLADNQHCNELL